MHQAIENFLDRASEGLRDDEELRLETRAELASHAEAKQRELMDAGKTEAEAVEETVKAMGEALEIAGELHEANRARMNLRAQVRRFLRFALVPLAMLAAAWSADLPRALDGVRSFRMVEGSGRTTNVKPRKALSDRERLVLYGDLNATNDVERQKAIWEADPTNRVYFGNYFTQTLSDLGDPADIPDDVYEAARVLDPGNAIYTYLEGRSILGDTESAESAGAMYLDREQAKSEGPASAPNYEVKDRGRLDRGMALIERALNMPDARPYQMDMLEERLAILGPPERWPELVQRLGLSASVLLPALTYQIQIARAANAYGDLLLREGDAERAATFLNAWETMASHLLAHAGTLIEVLVAGVVVEEGRVAAAVYREAGMVEEAERVQARVAAAAAPMQKWKQARETVNTDLEQVLEVKGGVLAGLLVPALGADLPPAMLEASRRLEYTVATEGLVSLVVLALFLAMAGCLLVALRRRFARHGRVIPLLLVPRRHDLAWMLGGGVLAPVALFLLVTRALPMSGHAYSLAAGSHRLVAEFALLALALVALPAGLASRAVRRRCDVLRIPTAALPALRARGYLVALGAGLLVVSWFLPAATGKPVGLVMAGAGAILCALGLAATALLAFFQGLGKNHGLFWGTLHRSLIPALAAAVVVLSLLSRPILHGSEAHYIQQDTMLLSSGAGFTSLEKQLTDRLRGEMLAVLDGLRERP